jgi:ketosteroid isomerase-like protein
MNRLFKHAPVIVLMLLATLTASAQTKKAGASHPSADAEFKALIERYYAAWNTLNADNAAPYYAQDADLVFYDVAPLKYNGWAEYKQGVQKIFFQNISSGKLTPYNDLKVMRRGNVAWTTLTFHLSGTYKDGKTMDVDCRHTAIWEKRGGKWLVVHEHVSAPLPG